MQSKTKNCQTRAQIEAMVAAAFGGAAQADGPQAVQELQDERLSRRLLDEAMDSLRAGVQP